MMENAVAISSLVALVYSSVTARVACPRNFRATCVPAMRSTMVPAVWRAQWTVKFISFAHGRARWMRL
jgi:hypothetical protein